MMGKNTMMKSENFYRLILVLMCTVLMLASPLVMAEDDEEEDLSFSFEEKLQSCGACHGENGDKPLLPEYPILAGQYPDYIAQALRQYKEGLRTNPIMAQQVELLELTDDDMERLGQYFGAKPGLKNLAR